MAVPEQASKVAFAEVEGGIAEGSPPLNNTFDLDLARWVTKVSEVFHVRIFMKEFVGQTLNYFFGPIGWPLQYFLYGGLVGMRNRSFFPASNNVKGFVLNTLVAWTCTFTALLVFLAFNPQDVSNIEVKFFFVNWFKFKISRF